MIDSHDLANMQADLALVIADDEVSITIRRDGESLEAQDVRLVKPGRSDPERSRSVAGKETTADIVVLGSLELDIQRGDKFIYGDILHEVIWVEPGQTIATQAEAVRCG